MTKILIALVSSLALFGLAFILASPASYSAEVKSLRGAPDIPESAGAEKIFPRDASGKFTKNYRQQPPLVPHKVDKYEIDLKINQCMRCHDWPRNVEENAPKISETHYVDRRTGKTLDRVARSRWFCTQCHVPQTDAKPLVKNTFKPVKIGQ